LKNFKLSVLFLLIIIFTHQVYAEDCYEYGESYSKLVFRADGYIKKGKTKQAARLLKEHLECWNNDKNVYVKLAEIYEYEQKYYLAGLAYKKAGMTQKYNEVTLKAQNSRHHGFQQYAISDSARYSKRYEGFKAFSIVFLSLGPIATAAGISLYVVDRLSKREYSMGLQYGLTLGGLSFIAAGTLMSSGAVNAYNRAYVYRKISLEYSGDPGTTPEEYFENSKHQRNFNIATADNYQKHGLALMGISIPLIGIAVYGFFDSYNRIKESNKDHGNWDPTGLDTFFAHFVQIFSLAPGIATFVGGTILLAKAARHEKAGKTHYLLTLDSVAPIIDPVSRTYGLSAGFSF
jgi:hypothetical protein